MNAVGSRDHEVNEQISQAISVRFDQPNDGKESVIGYDVEDLQTFRHL